MGVLVDPCFLEWRTDFSRGKSNGEARRTCEVTRRPGHVASSDMIVERMNRLNSRFKNVCNNKVCNVQVDNTGRQSTSRSRGHHLTTKAKALYKTREGRIQGEAS